MKANLRSIMMMLLTLAAMALTVGAGFRWSSAESFDSFFSFLP